VNCFDCPDNPGTPAVAICGRCGAGLCRAHTHTKNETLTITAAINRTIPVSPPARKLRCGACHAAEQAQGAR
jgi:hypothetical protein